MSACKKNKVEFNITIDPDLKEKFQKKYGRKSSKTIEKLMINHFKEIENKAIDDKPIKGKKKSMFDIE